MAYEKTEDKKETIRIGLIQMSMSDDAEANTVKAVEMIGKAARKGARIICLPELFNNKYFCREQKEELFGLAEKIPGETTKKLSEAAKINKAVIIAGIFEKRAEGVYNNSAVVIDPSGKILGVYRKMHIPEDPVDYHEKLYFAPGEEFISFKTEYGEIGVLICWDQWFPEAARITALKGAKIIFYPTAIGWSPDDSSEKKEVQLSAWKTIQRSHSIANGVFVAAANRVGREGNIIFWGSSFVSGPFGENIANAGSGKEAILIPDCDLGSTVSSRRGWPFLRDRRIDSYGEITRRFLD